MPASGQCTTLDRCFRSHRQGVAYLSTERKTERRMKMEALNFVTQVADHNPSPAFLSAYGDDETRAHTIEQPSQKEKPAFRPST